MKGGGRVEETAMSVASGDLCSLPRRLRESLRANLPQGASLRRARNGWLFESNALWMV